MPFSSTFTYCPHCATPLRDHRHEEVVRPLCPKCGWVQYLNPTVGVAVVLVEHGQILLGHRQGGGWCIPCGHVEFDETVQEAAIREMAEETGLSVSLHGLCAVKSNFHDPDHQTVGVWFFGRRVGGTPRAGGDLIEIAHFDLDALPPLIFPTDREVVQQVRSSQAVIDPRRRHQT